MDTTAYLPLTAAVGLQRKMDVTANNLANVTTNGFRGQSVAFEQLLTQTDTHGTTAYGQDRLSYSNTEQGALLTTQNPLDVAVQGDGWFGYQTEAGDVALGRDGRFVIDPEGNLVTTAGRPVLDLAGAPLVLPIDQGPPVIGRDGTISNAEGEILGQLGVFSAEGIETWERLGATMFAPRGGEPTPLEPAEAPIVVQGALEQSNVNPVTEMVRMIETQRRFEQALNAASNHDELRRSTLSRLGQTA